MKQFEIDAIAKLIAKSLAEEAIKRESEIESLKAMLISQHSQIEVLKGMLANQNLSIQGITSEVVDIRASIPVIPDIPQLPDLSVFATREFAIALNADSVEHLTQRLDSVKQLCCYDDEILKLRTLVEDYRTALPSMADYVLKTEFTAKLHQVEYNYKMHCDEVEVSAQTMVELAVTNLNGVLEAKSAEIQSKFDSLSLNIDINSTEIPYYVEGEVVRAGVLRRFGVGGMSMAVVDTARGPHVAPGDWRTVVDGHTPVPTADGVLYRSLSGNTDFTIKHGINGADGKEGQRGKTGSQGAQGVPGVGIRSVEVTENGMAVILSTGAVHAFNLSEPLAHAIEEVSGLIDYKIDKRVTKLLSKGE